MFASLLVLCNSYCKLAEAGQSVPNPPREDLASEVRERLSQLAFISVQLDAINAQFGVTAMITKTGENGETEYYNAAPERDEHLRFVMRLLTESFYYFAFRVRQILRNDVHRFPGLRGFECPGVRDVRNHLIEHPEGAQSRVFNSTFAWSPGTGMQLKAARHEWETSAVHDAGFNANASEFVNSLTNSLQNAIRELGNQGGAEEADGALDLPKNG